MNEGGARKRVKSPPSPKILLIFNTLGAAKPLSLFTPHPKNYDDVFVKVHLNTIKNLKFFF